MCSHKLDVPKTGLHYNQAHAVEKNGTSIAHTVAAGAITEHRDGACHHVAITSTVNVSGGVYIRLSVQYRQV